MVDVNYSEAVQALASGINAKSGSLDGDRKIQLARSLIHQDDVESLDEWSEIELNLSENARKKLQRYLGELQSAYNAEIGKEIHLSIENARKLSELREKLKEDIDIALNESHELEKIAERLQDSDIGKIAGKEEHEINELGRKLEKLDKKGRGVDQLEQKLLDTTNNLGIGHGELHQTLEKRSKTVGQLIKKATTGGGPTLTEPWQLVAKDPTDEPDDWRVASSDRWKDGWGWGGASYKWMSNGSAKADQGWKIHVAADADNKKEVFQVMKAIIPVLNSMKGERKFGRSAESMRKDIHSSARMKISTIYPDPDDSRIDHVNQNKKRTQSIVGRLITNLQDAGLLKMSTPVKTVAEFNVQVKGTPTRIFIRYDTLGGDKIVDKDGKDFGGRKPGVVPEGFEAKLGKSIGGRDIRELPGLQFPSFQISLPSTNFDK